MFELYNFRDIDKLRKMRYNIYNNKPWHPKRAHNNAQLFLSFSQKCSPCERFGINIIAHKSVG